MNNVIKALLEDVKQEYEASQGLTIRTKKGLEWTLDHEKIIKRIDEILETFK